MKKLIATFLVATMYFSSAENSAAEPTCDELPKEAKLASSAMTIEDVEKESLEGAKKNPDIPQLPFGFLNKQWVKFRAKLQPGDQLFKFIYSSQEAGGYAYGGYVALRGSCVVGRIQTWIT